MKLILRTHFQWHDLEQLHSLRSPGLKLVPCIAAATGCPSVSPCAHLCIVNENIPWNKPAAPGMKTSATAHLPHSPLDRSKGYIILSTHLFMCLYKTYRSTTHLSRTTSFKSADLGPLSALHQTLSPSSCLESL